MLTLDNVRQLPSLTECNHDSHPDTSVIGYVLVCTTGLERNTPCGDLRHDLAEFSGPQSYQEALSYKSLRNQHKLIDGTYPTLTLDTVYAPEGLHGSWCRTSKSNY